MRAALRIALATLLPLGLLAGCYESHECGSPEECNYADDDCDFRYDEDFRDDAGVYFTKEHCGGCGVDCDEQLPTAAETECVVDAEEGTAGCRIVACPEGWHLSGDGSCAPDVPVLCLPCAEDADCELRMPGARCHTFEGGDKRCLRPCEMGCPPGFECGVIAEDLAACLPVTGECSCTEETLGAEFACLFDRDGGHACAGARVCDEDGLSACEPVLGEACNETDDDCDGEVDEDFRDDAGHYVGRLHCGGCASPCVEPGPNMTAECVPDGPGPADVQCIVECEEGFVDVDGIAANGCECERFDGEGPPPAIGGDADCDGVADDNDDFIYVTTTGSDTNPGTLAEPMRSVQAALARGDATDKDVLVARGIYDGPFDIVGGVSIFGGYRPDFRDRDLTLFPVVVERRRGASPGAPVITCDGVTEPTRIEGFTVQGTDATAPGEGSTAMYLRGCGPEVRFAALTVFAGRGADGARGDSSSDNLAEIGLSSLDQLDGADGSAGRPADEDGICGRVPSGAGGSKSCPGGDVSGGDGGDAACPETGCVNGEPCGNAGCTDYTVGGVCDFDAVLADAVPNPAPESGRGPAGGEGGELTYNSPTNRGVCNFCDDNPTLPRIGDEGQDGETGSDGEGGSGCAAAPRLDPATGRVRGGDGADGVAGSDGSGGGGGSPGAGYEVIEGTSGDCFDRSGGSGGGGGSGGCGAPRAEGGTGGGASVGIVVRLDGRPQGPGMEDVRIVTASGGDGGDGGIGAAGGGGGSGAVGGPARFWCSRAGGRGGDGGRGGAGGGGGGGCGGGSHGIFVDGGGDAYRDALADGTTIEETGVPGRGGVGGFSPGAAGTDGEAGADDAVR